MNGTTDGTRGQCAEGGELNACPEAERTPEGACWRLVDCAAIDLESTNNFDWARCVDDIEGLSTVGEMLTIDCIAESSCDQLKVPNSPDNTGHDDFQCIRLGEGGNN